MVNFTLKTLLSKKVLFFIILVNICWGAMAQTLPYTFTNNSRYADADVYIGLVGQFPGKGAVWMNMTNSTLVTMDAAYNTIQGPAWATAPGGGNKYADMFTKLSNIPNKTINIPQGLYGCRVFVAFKSPLYIYFFPNGGGYAGADLNNPNDPSDGIRWELIEITWGNAGLWTNTSRVDAYQYPMALEVTGFNGGMNGTYLQSYNAAVAAGTSKFYGKVGELVSHQSILSQWPSSVSTEFQGCRLVQTHSLDNEPIIKQITKIPDFKVGGKYSNYFDSYISNIWSTYSTQDLLLNIGDQGTWRGRVTGNTFNFTSPNGTRTATIYTLPTTTDAVEGAGALATTTATPGSQRYNDDLMIQAQVCAGINRHAIITTTPAGVAQVNGDSTRFFQVAPYNQYVKFFHQPAVSFNSKTYAFAYDDVGDHSSTIQCTFPTKVSVIIGAYGGEGTGGGAVVTANAGVNQTVTDVANAGSASISLNGSASTATNCTISTYVWTENNTQIATGATPTVNLADGTHNITLTVTGSTGLTASSSVTVVVKAAGTSTQTPFNVNKLIVNLGTYGVWAGSAAGDKFVFTNLATGATATIPSRPSTQNVFASTGALSSPSSAADLMIQNQICAAINRHAISLSAANGATQNLSDTTKYYQQTPYNGYAAFFHSKTISYNGKSFAYNSDSAQAQASVIKSTSPSNMTITIGGFGYGSTTVSVSSVNLTPSTATIATGATVQLTASVLPSNATNKAVSYATNNSAVATVSAAGLVTGVAAGSATITVTTADGGKIGTSVITVYTPVSGVSLNPTTLSLANGATSQLTATVSPANATNQALTYASSNAAVASVSTSGLVTAVGAGNATITVTTADGAKTAICAVTVTSAVYPIPGTIQAENYASMFGVQTEATTDTGAGLDVGWIDTGDYMNYNVNVTTAGTYNLTFRVATTTATAVVQLKQGTTVLGTLPLPNTGGWQTWQTIGINVPLSAGAQTLQVYASTGGFNLNWMTFSTISVSGVSLSPATASVAAGATVQLISSISPNPVTNSAVTYTSSNTSIATVSSTGLVTGIAAGTAVITVTTADGAKTATSTITVTPTGGLNGAYVAGTSAVVLSTVGSADWKDFYANDHKASGTMINSISNATAVGGLLSYYGNDLRGMSWTGGTPTASANNTNGIYNAGVNNGFSFTVAAGNGNNSVYVYVGGYSASGTFRVHLSNSSAADYVYTTPNTAGQWDGTFTINYNAAQAGQTITVTWTMAAGTGNVCLQAAALVGTAKSMTIEQTNADAVNKEFMVYPNPVQAQFVNLGLTGFEDGVATLQLISMAGAVVKEQAITIVSSTSTEPVDVSQLSNGIYIVVLKTGSEVQTTKLFVRH